MTAIQLQQRAQKVDSRKITASRHMRGKLERSVTEQHSSSSSRTHQSNSQQGPGAATPSLLPAARSLDESSAPTRPHHHNSSMHHLQHLELEMRPLSIRTRSLSPLRQQLRHSFGSIAGYGRNGSQASDESVLDWEHAAAIWRTWREANARLATFAPERCFGFFVFDRLFEVAPQVKEMFGVEAYARVDDVPQEHAFNRHVHVFNDLLDLSVRNVDELETEMAPVLFAYGRRHYQHAALHEKFNEETVRLFCSQVVCTVADLLGNEELPPLALEAWVEMMRHLGSALLSGYESEKAAHSGGGGGVGGRKKMSFNNLVRQHAFFVL